MFSTAVIRAWKEELKEAIATYLVAFADRVEIRITVELKNPDKTITTSKLMSVVDLLDKDPRWLLVDMLSDNSKAVERANNTP